MKFCGGDGRFLLARRGSRARISPFSQITEQMLTQFRRLIERYSVFRKCWLEYTMSEKLGAAPVRSLFFFHAESLRIAGPPDTKFDESYSPTAVRARIYAYVFTSFIGRWNSIVWHWHLFMERRYLLENVNKYIFKIRSFIKSKL